jgi:CRISPR-associated endonuclease/helicase Cas3
MRIHTLATFSKLADQVPTELANKLPTGWHLSQHQVATYQALTDPATSIVVNTAMTGDGKSLAGQLPFLVNRDHTILAHYPTNELIEDQYASAINTMQPWGVKQNRLSRLSAGYLDALWQETLARPGVGELRYTRSDTLSTLLQEYRVIFSNPDILHAILQFHYQQPGRAATHIAHMLTMAFKQFTFDEFHVFDTPEINAVLTGLLFLFTQQPSQQQNVKALFLSATPDPRLITPLEQLGLSNRLQIINPQQAGWYAYGTQPDATWRQILQASSLEFVPQRAEEWLEANIEGVIKDWFRRHGKHTKAAIIVRSVASALRIEKMLRQRLPEYIRVATNTGIDGQAQRKKSYQAEILIGTSTVDVGVDFRINLLIFEADSASQFMQRFGRLGRHTFYTDDTGNQYDFHEFHAVALVAPFIYERLCSAEAEQTPRLSEGQALQRDHLSQHINEVYHELNVFGNYPQTWGRFQGANVINSLSKEKASFSATLDVLLQQYRILNKANYKQTKAAWEEYQKSKQLELVKTALQFRGGSQFQAAILRVDQAAPSIVTYDLLWLLANADLEYLTPEQFEREAASYGLKLSPSQKPYIKFYFRWKQHYEIRNELTIKLLHSVANWDQHQFYSAQVLKGFTVRAGNQPFITQIEDQLLQTPSVALLIPNTSPLQVKQLYYLPFLLPLYPYEIMDSTDIGSIAFGRTALLLDSLFAKQKPIGNKPFTC